MGIIKYAADKIQNDIVLSQQILLMNSYRDLLTLVIIVRAKFAGNIAEYSHV